MNALTGKIHKPFSQKRERMIVLKKMIRRGGKFQGGEGNQY
jgi:hypothetical protein